MKGLPVFAVYPEDWIGRTIIEFEDGTVMLDSGLTTKERLARGDAIAREMTIRPETTRQEIEEWLT